MTVSEKNAKRRNEHIVECMKSIIQVFIDNEYSEYDDTIIHRINDQLSPLIMTGKNKEHKITAYNALFKPIVQFKMNSTQIESHYINMVHKYSPVQQSHSSSNVVNQSSPSLDVRQEILRHIHAIKLLLESP